MTGAVGPQDIEAIVEAAISCGFGSMSSRAVLMAGISPAYVSQLSVCPRPADQLRSDLHGLSQAQLEDHEPPLLIWLSNAEACAKPRVQANVFKSIRDRLTSGASPDGGRGRPNAAQQSMLVQRGMDRSTPRMSATVRRGPAEILFLSASPRTMARLDIGRELRGIKESIKMGRLRGSIRIGEVELALRTTDIGPLVRNARPVILHFSGHGRAGRICLEDPHGYISEVAPEAFRNLIAQTGDSARPRLAFLSFAESSIAADVLLRSPAVIDCAIAITDIVTDEAALSFSRGFYSAIADGFSIQAATAAGRSEVELMDPNHNRDAKEFVLLAGC